MFSPWFGAFRALKCGGVQSGGGASEALPPSTMVQASGLQSRILDGLINNPAGLPLNPASPRPQDRQHVGRSFRMKSKRKSKKETYIEYLFIRLARKP